MAAPKVAEKRAAAERAAAESDAAVQRVPGAQSHVRTTPVLNLRSMASRMVAPLSMLSPRQSPRTPASSRAPAGGESVPLPSPHTPKRAGRGGSVLVALLMPPRGAASPRPPPPPRESANVRSSQTGHSRAMALPRPVGRGLDRKAMMLWAKEATSGYKGVDIQNWSRSWNDGLAFCALLDAYFPQV